MDRRTKWRLANPSYRYYENARRRCLDTKSERWRIYREKGIKCEITAAEVKEIWERDRAWELKRPSLDRFPNCEGNYTKGNVRFIEFNENSRIASDRRWAAVAAAKPEPVPEFT